jgi:hypothetical protein
MLLPCRPYASPLFFRAYALFQVIKKVQTVHIQLVGKGEAKLQEWQMFPARFARIPIWADGYKKYCPYFPHW